MNWRKIIEGCFVTVVLCACYLNSKAQAVRIGDRCPDFESKKVLNYPMRSIKLSQFAGKAVILEFWSSWCLNCIEALPKLDSIQKIFQSDLQIILVSKESDKKVVKTFDRYPSLEKLSFISIVEDTLLSHLFPSIGLPHQVWIDKHGVVKAITDGTYTSVENIKRLIDGYDLSNLPVKLGNPNESKSNKLDALITQGNSSGKERVLFYSYISKYRSELGSGYSIPQLDSESGTIRVKATNVPIEKLYQLAYDSAGPAYGPFILRLFSDSSRFRADFRNMENLFCYDMISNDSSKCSFLTKMRKDLDLKFSIVSRRITIPIECLVLKRVACLKEIESKGKGPPLLFIKDGFMVFNRVPFYNFVQYSLKPRFKHPFLDETGYSGKVSLKLPAELRSVEKMDSLLSKYGLSLRRETRLLEVVGLFDQ